jgi:hypothetical protein
MAHILPSMASAVYEDGKWSVCHRSRASTQMTRSPPSRARQYWIAGVITQEPVKPNGRLNKSTRDRKKVGDEVWVTDAGNDYPHDARERVSVCLTSKVPFPLELAAGEMLAV